MSTEDFPNRLPEKLKAIREQLGMTPDQLADFVGARTGAEILAYENDEDDLLVSVLFGLPPSFDSRLTSAALVQITASSRATNKSSIPRERVGPQD
jgi:transcriptional regulator with XRE-family HTH domain